MVFSSAFVLVWEEVIFYHSFANNLRLIEHNWLVTYGTELSHLFDILFVYSFLFFLNLLLCIHRLQVFIDLAFVLLSAPKNTTLGDIY